MTPTKEDLQQELRDGVAVLKELHLKGTQEWLRVPEMRRAMARCFEAEHRGAELGYWPPPPERRGRR